MTFNFGSVNSIRTIFLNQLLVFKVCVCLRNLSCSYHWRVFILHGCIALAACRECVLCHHFVSPPGGHLPHVSSHFPLLPTFLLFCIAHRQVDCCVCANHRQQWEELCLPKAEESNPIPVVAACTHSFPLFPPPLSSSVSHQQNEWFNNYHTRSQLLVVAPVQSALPPAVHVYASPYTQRTGILSINNSSVMRFSIWRIFGYTMIPCTSCLWRGRSNSTVHSPPV